jgi:aminoglycoside phosphotransferase family enzyme
MSGESRPRAAPSYDERAKVALLQRPETYPEDPGRLETVETHMSWVFLTERHAYKLKKPVRYEYLDFSTLASRRKNCEEELRLNQRLAPGVYLAVVPLAVDARGNARLEGAGEILDWLVKMRRLPADRMLDNLIRRQAVSEAEVRNLAAGLAAFYRESPPVRLPPAEYRRRCERSVYANRRALSDRLYDLPAGEIAAVHEAQERILRYSPELFDTRVQAGRIVEGHGDLRPEHVCLEREPVIFDRLEFNREFRIVDAADELAFLSMECERLGAPSVGPVLFQVYEETTGDRPPPPLVSFYKAYRACLRAKLAIWHTRELPPPQWRKWRALAADYLALAAGYARRLRPE